MMSFRNVLLFVCHISSRTRKLRSLMANRRLTHLLQKSVFSERLRLSKV